MRTNGSTQDSTHAMDLVPTNIKLPSPLLKQALGMLTVRTLASAESSSSSSVFSARIQQLIIGHITKRTKDGQKDLD